MDAAYEVTRVVCIVAFLGYGATCLTTEHMVREFARYGLSRARTLTGWLEIAGGLGIALGYWIPFVGLAAAGGLALLMVLGIGTRIRIADPLPAMAPAITFLALNVFLLVYGLQRTAPLA
ncbi:MAG: DoxX family protein [Planctomycetota bacterium]|nr:DoxX family protein [Planctomycetota bacterium]